MPTFGSAPGFHLGSPSESHLCDGRTSITMGCSLHFLCPNFQIAHEDPELRSEPPKRRKLSLAAWENSFFFFQGAGLVPDEAMLVHFLQTTSLWLSEKAFTFWDRIGASLNWD